MGLSNIGKVWLNVFYSTIQRNKGKLLPKDVYELIIENAKNISDTDDKDSKKDVLLEFMKNAGLSMSRDGLLNLKWDDMYFNKNFNKFIKDVYFKDGFSDELVNKLKDESTKELCRDIYAQIKNTNGAIIYDIKNHISEQQQKDDASYDVFVKTVDALKEKQDFQNCLEFLYKNDFNELNFNLIKDKTKTKDVNVKGYEDNMLCTAISLIPAIIGCVSNTEAFVNANVSNMRMLLYNELSKVNDAGAEKIFDNDKDFVGYIKDNGKSDIYKKLFVNSNIDAHLSDMEKYDKSYVLNKLREKIKQDAFTDTKQTFEDLKNVFKDNGVKDIDTLESMLKNISSFDDDGKIQNDNILSKITSEQKYSLMENIDKVLGELFGKIGEDIERDSEILVKYNDEIQKPFEFAPVFCLNAAEETPFESIVCRWANFLSCTNIDGDFKTGFYDDVKSLAELVSELKQKDEEANKDKNEYATLNYDNIKDKFEGFLNFVFSSLKTSNGNMASFLNNTDIKGQAKDYFTLVGDRYNNSDLSYAEIIILQMKIVNVLKLVLSKNKYDKDDLKYYKFSKLLVYCNGGVIDIINNMLQSNTNQPTNDSLNMSYEQYLNEQEIIFFNGKVIYEGAAFTKEEFEKQAENNGVITTDEYDKRIEYICSLYCKKDKDGNPTKDVATLNDIVNGNVVKNENVNLDNSDNNVPYRPSEVIDDIIKQTNDAQNILRGQ